ncbi:hypothetical protein JMUB6875_17220 [Nocardia sp. JMUB6875]|uniref:STAS domain-containing protein n=1 Tax=Nocardia sp. JMUB6875 TaxID=3158170 RepID=UPI0032E5C364
MSNHSSDAVVRGTREPLEVMVSRPTRAMTVLTATGEVDRCTVGTLRARLTEAIDSEADLVVTDLSRLSFFGLCGLRLMLEADDHARHHHTSLRWVTGSRCVDRVIEICGHADDLRPAATITGACTPGPRASRTT